MEWKLEAAEARVLGSLMEKEITTPDYYPLSLNALVNACNQRSNRDPVVDFDENTVEDALAALRGKGLAMRITGGESRVPKHAQRFTEQFNLGRREAAVICVLLLRGPQTLGELRGRTERLYGFDGLQAVESTLDRLAELGFAAKLPRQTGFKEPRYGHLLCGEPAVVDEPPAMERAPSDRERLAALETALLALKQEFEDFKRRFE